MDQTNIPTLPSRFCRHCWAWLPDTARFCGLCGQLSQVMGDSIHIPTEKSRYSSIDNMTVPHDTKGTELSENQYKSANLMPMQPLLSSANESTISDSDENSSIVIPLPSPYLSSEDLLTLSADILIPLPPPVLSSEDFPTLGAEGQSYLHGLHQQSGFDHGLHQQPGFDHGLHQQPGFEHGLHQQPGFEHGLHQQPGFEHGLHQQPGFEHGTSHSRLIARTKRAKIGRSSWMGSIVIMAAIVAVIGVALLTRYAMGSGPSIPGLTVIGNAIPGHSITLKGNNFSAGHKVKVALDNQPLASGDQNKQVTETQHTSMMSILTLLASQALPADNWITVNSDGTFTVIVPIDAHWDKGSKHSLSVYGQDNKLIASTGFQVVAPSLALCVVVGSHAAISLGPITEGDSQTVSTPFKLCSGGSGDLDWTSSWDQQQAPWLQLAQSGHLKAPQAQQIQISASAQNLTAGSYTADITFTGSPGNTKVALKVTLRYRIHL